MEKFKEKILNLMGDQKYFIKKYCGTFLLIFAITILMVVQGFKPEHINEFYVAIMLTTVLVFVIEALTEFKWYRPFLYIIAFLLSIIAKELLFTKDFALTQRMMIVGIYLFSVLIAIYKIIKDSKITFSQYLTRVLANSIIAGILFIVVELGIMFIVGIANGLLFRTTDLMIFAKTQILLNGLVFIPVGILCLLNTKNDVILPLKVLICYVVLPIIIMSEVIIYIYMIKILALSEVPSNTIFPIITALFAFAGPIWVMIDSFKENSKFIKANTKIIPISFIPLIGMQIYAVGIRIAQMGLTPERYLGIMLVIFEIILVALTIIKNQKYIDKIVLVTSALVLIIMSIPGINVMDACWNNQLNRLTSVYTENTNIDELSEKDKKKAQSAYRYLNRYKEGKKHIPFYINTKKLNSIPITK